MTRITKHAPCAVCGRCMALHKNGTVRAHVRYTGVTRYSVRCEGTSQPPKAEVKP